MGTPDNLEEYVRFETEDLTVYVSQALLEKLESGATEQPFYIDGYGRYTLVLDEFEEARNEPQGTEAKT